MPTSRDPSQRRPATSSSGHADATNVAPTRRSARPAPPTAASDAVRAAAASRATATRRGSVRARGAGRSGQDAHVAGRTGPDPIAAHGWAPVVSWPRTPSTSTHVPAENGAPSAARLAPSTIRSGPLPSSTSKLTVPLEAVRADATTAPRTTTSCASNGLGRVAAPKRPRRRVDRGSEPPRGDRHAQRLHAALGRPRPATSSSWPRETLPASSPSRRRMAPLPSWMTADPVSTVPDASVTTPRTVRRAFLAAARALAIGTTGPLEAEGVGVGSGRASRWPSETASGSQLRAPRRRRPHAAARDIPTFRCRTNRAGRPRRSRARRHRPSSRQCRSRWRYRRRRGRRRSRHRRRRPGLR